MSKINKKNPLKEFLKTPYSIIIYLICLVLVLMIFNLYIMKSINVYVFNGYSDELTVLDGTIYTGFDVNTFGAPNIIYTGKEIILKEYKIGYYIDDSKISVVQNNEEKEGIKLSELIENTEFSFTELHKDAYYFSKENIKKINKLTFKITGVDKKGNKIDIEIPLNVAKVSK